MLSFARVRALAILAVLILGAGISVGLALTRDTSLDPAAEECPAGWPVADLTLRDEQDIKINLYDGTGDAARAGGVAEILANRGFEVLETGNDPQETAVDGVALLRYGPEAVGSAQLLRAYFLDDAADDIQLDREGDEVDVILGAQFQQLATPTEVTQAIALIGRPNLPPNTCAAEE